MLHKSKNAKQSGMLPPASRIFHTNLGGRWTVESKSKQTVMATRTGHYKTKKKCQEHLKKDSNNQVKTSDTHSRGNNRQKN